MTRPHIDFIHVDDIDWVELALPGGNIPVRMKPLSRDPDTGGVTAVVEFPPGFERRETGYNTSDEDIFYLEGEMTWGDQTRHPYCYAFHPSGKLREPLRTSTGSVVFASFTETPHWHPSDEPGPMHSIDGCMFFVIVRGPIGNIYEPVDGYELPPMRGGTESG